jgi:trk system potassium uptake protein TrkH
MKISRGLKKRLTPSQILVMGFAITILIGAILLTLPIASNSREGTRFIDALFTAASATCVTGLVVVDTGSHFSLFGQIVILFLIQIGGLGFMTMATLMALVMRRKITFSERLVMKEALNTRNLQGVVKLAKAILITTLLIESVGAILLSFRWVPQLGLYKGLYFGIFHSISGFCNAGFDILGPINGPFTSLTLYVGDPLVSLVVAVLVILGGIGFLVITDLYHCRRFARLTLHSKVAISVTSGLVITGTILIFIFEHNRSMLHMSYGTKILAAFFQAVTPRTAGFNTLDMTQLTTATLFMIIILMFIGASPGGTAGGIKTTTFGTLLLGVWSIITGNQDINIFGKRIPQDQVLKSLAVVVLSILLITGVVMVMSITEQADFLTLLFETVSAFGTVGLSMNFSPNLSDFGRISIVFTMFVGRLGPMTLAIALWERQKTKKYRYPEEKVIIG